MIVFFRNPTQSRGAGIILFILGVIFRKKNRPIQAETKKMKPWTIATFETVFTDFFHKFVSISISIPLLQSNYKLVVFLWSELEPLNK
jgi:hypothetical protein